MCNAFFIMSVLMKVSMWILLILMDVLLLLRCLLKLPLEDEKVYSLWLNFYVARWKFLLCTNNVVKQVEENKNKNYFHSKRIACVICFQWKGRLWVSCFCRRSGIMYTHCVPNETACFSRHWPRYFICFHHKRQWVKTPSPSFFLSFFFFFFSFFNSYNVF